LEAIFAFSSGGKSADAHVTVSTVLVSVFSHSGVFTNWRAVDGTSGTNVTFHLDMDNGVFSNRKDVV